MADTLELLRDAYEYDNNRWDPIRKEAKTDMAFVAGNPWTKDDDKQRENRPTVAPEEMGQYFNQVINPLWANPRGMKFAPTGNGASEKGAEFYQNKAREIEYRSHAKVAYIGAAVNAIQRSYGFVSVDTRFASPRSANQDLWIEGFPNPDMVLPDTDALRADSSDMKHCFEYSWMKQSEFKRDYKDAKIKNFADLANANPLFLQGDKILVSKFWNIRTRPRKLLLVELPMPPAPPRALVPVQTRPQQVQVFDDELTKLPPGSRVLRELRDVDYPEVWWHLNNGLEILDEGEWPGKYIPIVSCYGKTIYTEGDFGMERKILSMTRFGRDPWKSYCYACSQQLEILGQVPKASVLAAAGQLKGYEKDWEESPHVPKAFLLYNAITDATGQQMLPAPQRLAYTQGENLQALEMVKEGFRRAIQSAMGSNFLPTQAQRRNEKSGVALDKIDQAASQGTYHFVNSYEDMIRQVGIICEDLMDKIYDYSGKTSTILADGTANDVHINTPDNPEAVDTKGDYLVTVSSAPSSDSQQDAAAEFVEQLLSNIQGIQAIAGPEVAKKILAFSVRARNIGPEGDQLAEAIDPPPPNGEDGKPVPPEVLAMQGQMKQMQQQLQQAGQMIQTEQIKYDSQFKIEKMKVDSEAALKLLMQKRELAAKIEAARIAAAKEASNAAAEANEERIALALDSVDQAADRQHELNLARGDHQSAMLQSAQDHQEAVAQGQQQHDNALEQGEQGVAGQLAVGQQAADNAPPPADAGAEA